MSGVENGMKRKFTEFTSPGKVKVKSERIPEPEKGQVLVKTSFSAISAGTEMLVYRGRIPEHMDLDSSIPALKKGFSYPLKYGYCAVGEVVKTGSKRDLPWTGTRVFCFKPHCSYFLADINELFPLPEGISDREAVLLPAMETAVNLVQDAQPCLGEKALVLGQGIVGILTAYLLSGFPLQDLICLDKYPLRCRWSYSAGCSICLDPGESGTEQALEQRLQSNYGTQGADFVVELTGDPEGLNHALQWTGFSGRIVVGSWYGDKRSQINLGGNFHRNRIQLISSQVSTISPGLSGRWTKQRRMDLAFQKLAQIGPEWLITHEFDIDDAASAYDLLDRSPEQALQVILRYQD